MKIYGTYRMVYTNRGVRYSPSFFLDKQFEDYKKAGLTATYDMEIPENRYTKELVPWVKSLSRFIVGEYNEKYVDGEQYTANVQRVGSQFQIDIFTTKEEAIQWIQDNTDLQEVESGKFLIAEASEDEMTWPQEAKYLIID